MRVEVVKVFLDLFFCYISMMFSIFLHHYLVLKVRHLKFDTLLACPVDNHFTLEFI